MLLVAALIAVVVLAKLLTPALEMGLAQLNVSKAVVGIVIAVLVLLPEGLAALRAARANRLQTCLNLALGSALASIGLTIPAVAAVVYSCSSASALKTRFFSRSPCFWGQSHWAPDGPQCCRASCTW